MKVAIIMGSTSDLGKVEPAVEILKDYGVEVNVRCLSAHRAHLGLSTFRSDHYSSRNGSGFTRCCGFTNCITSDWCTY